MWIIAYYIQLCDSLVTMSVGLETAILMNYFFSVSLFEIHYYLKEVPVPFLRLLKSFPFKNQTFNYRNFILCSSWMRRCIIWQMDTKCLHPHILKINETSASPFLLLFFLSHFSLPFCHIYPSYFCVLIPFYCPVAVL